MRQFTSFEPVRMLAGMVLAVLLADPASAAEPVTGESMSLESLVDQVLANNPEKKFYEAEIQAAIAGRRSAGLLANPELNASFGRKTLRGDGLSSDGVAWSVSVLQPFEWPGRIGLRKSIANRDIELAELGLKQFETALAGRVRALGYRLFATHEKAASAAEVASRFRALREVLVQREPAGLTPLLEMRVIEATELNAARKASEGILATQSALLELNQLRGVPPDSRLVVSEANLSFRPLESRETLLSLARTNNFELRLRMVELAQQGFRVALARNERFPAIRVGPTFSEEHAGDREQIFGVEVSVPLPLWNRNRAGIESARARETQAEVSLAVAVRDVERRVLEAALIYETKLREMENWRPDSAAHFREAAELADRHYRLGAVPISTYVELQKQYVDAVEGLLETRMEVLNAAAELELLTGLTTPLAQISNEPRKDAP